MIVSGRLVLDDEVAAGHVEVVDGLISNVWLDEAALEEFGERDTPFVTPGFVDVHVHGWGGHDAMGGADALDGMARALARHGVTSFLPTAVTAPLDALARFADSVRGWAPRAPHDGAQPLGFNLEGPFLSEARRGAHDPDLLRAPSSVPLKEMEPFVESMRVITIAPELDGALRLIAYLRAMGVVISLGHSAATYDQALDGYAAGATSTTHLFNAMNGVDHRSPGLATVALLDDDVYTELIADRNHVLPVIWPLITRLKPVDRLVLVSDAISLAGTGDGRGRIGTLDVEVIGTRATLAGSDTLAGSVIALDTAVRNLEGTGVPLIDVVAAASRNPLAMLGIEDRGHLAIGQQADLVVLDRSLEVRRVMIRGQWLD